MKSIINFLRKIGFLRIGSGDYRTGELDDRKNLYKNKNVKKENGIDMATEGTFLAATITISSVWMNFFWALVGLIVLFFIFIFRNYGLSFFGLLFAFLWFLFFQNFKTQFLAGKILVWKMLLIFIALFFFSLVFLIPASDEVVVPNNDSNNQKTDEVLMQVNQANFSSFVFGSSSRGDYKTDTVNITINPILTFKLDGDKDVKLESFEIRGLEFTKKPSVGEIKIIHPKHRKTDESCTGFYYGGCDDKSTPDQVKDDGGDIIYEVVESDDPSQIKTEYYDQVFDNWFVRPEFRVIVQGVGSFDYDNVMKKYKSVSGSKYPEYAKIKADDLASVLEFDVVAKLSNGEKFKKHFVTKFNGDDLLKGTTVQMEY